MICTTSVSSHFAGWQVESWAIGREVQVWFRVLKKKVSFSALSLVQIPLGVLLRVKLGATKRINFFPPILLHTVQQALRVKWRVFGVFVCFDLYFVNYRSWQAEILQECAEGCIQGNLQKKIRQT